LSHATQEGQGETRDESGGELSVWARNIPIARVLEIIADERKWQHERDAR
jgi:hypothetical protein